MEQIFLDFLDGLQGGKPPIRSVQDLIALDSATLLSLADKLPGELLPLLVRTLKESQEGNVLFQKLMGDHDEDNRELVDRFFYRYMNLVVEDPLEEYNPLIHYLDPEMFRDIALIQSRELFFKRQSIVHINEFLSLHFQLDEEFQPGQQDEAWAFFFGELLRV